LAIRQAFLELYSQSGRNKVSGVSAYADPERNTKLVLSPSMTLLAESTPEVFFECFDASHVAEGLVSRLLVVEYAGDRPSRNRQAGAEPPAALVSAVERLAQTALSMQQSTTFCQVPQDAEALALLDAFDLHAKGEINAKKKGTEPALWNRAHLSALKVATLLAVGSNVGNPVVRADHARWAIDFVKQSVQTVVSRFQRGEVGGGDSSKASARVQKELSDFVAMSPAQRGADDLRIPKSMQQQNRCIPFAYLLERTKRVQPFKDKPHLLKSTLDDMVKSGTLLRLTAADAWTQFKSRGEVYALGADWRL